MFQFAKYLVSISSSFLFTGCLFDSGSDNIVDDYEVVWIDTYSSRRLNKHEVLVPAYVFAVGHNSKFIFAKQHPVVPNLGGKIDTSTVSFYIIERTENEFQDKPVYGPLSRSGFDSLCSKLSIVRPQFDLIYSTNP